MKQITSTLIIALMLVMSGCQEKTDSVSIANPDSDIMISFRLGYDIWNPEDPQEQQQLADVWNSANHNEWDIIEGMINLANGGMIIGTPESWPNGFEFSVEIPEGTVAIQEHGPSPTPRGRELGPLIVNVQIMVPKATTQLLAPVFKLKPDLVFNQPVKVTVCYPPWEQVDPDQEYTKYCIHKSNDSPPVYFITDLGILQPISAQPRYGNGDPHLGISFLTYHFSRWKLKRGRGVP